MARRIVKIIEAAERATLEAPDDPIVWLSHAPADVRARGLGRDELLGAAQPIAQAALPELLGRFEQVWHF